MGFLSCFGCGSSDQEKTDVAPQKQEFTNDNVGTKNVNNNGGSGELENSAVPPDNNLSVDTGLKPQESPNNDLASTTPTDAPSQISRAPEESFGNNHLITDEQVRSRAYDRSPQPSSISLDPGVTEEDRWFETK